VPSRLERSTFHPPGSGRHSCVTEAPAQSRRPKRMGHVSNTGRELHRLAGGGRLPVALLRRWVALGREGNRRERKLRWRRRARSGVMRDGHPTTRIRPSLRFRREASHGTRLLERVRAADRALLAANGPAALRTNRWSEIASARSGASMRATVRSARSNRVVARVSFIPKPHHSGEIVRPD
jgi:hypothetical protein